MKKLLIGLLALGSFSSFASSKLNTAINYINKQRIIYLECEENVQRWDCEKTAKALKMSLIGEKLFINTNSLIENLRLEMNYSESAKVRANLATIIDNLYTFNLTGDSNILE